ncbi:PpiC-type peptidyl-prolyl cis-trans isomerase [Geobacter metallireducens RCH3]|uniref:Peptidylprolyl cis-trans isomerase, PpiC-type n=1 Tax=Geobacter metallireducens (strain ATCC 53774 / DSM 7210 / GS-15) TaxID=269799 RepID=Q39XG7_GEOMG|nr:peptidylprolyl isomerase [Geobacter metallireducens]ABB31057.1 peptidylprolyl cis-trans isomerase, PpiC-type [Geobacter metallireducens GS-15]EHP84560.1 PpiC-type peptidyl-prolyl cis-trans isomerase [Geobacter metallireducens RCH3]
MNVFKTARRQIIALSAIALLAGTAGANAAPTAKADAKAGEAPSATTAVARVNGVDITRAELERAKKIILSRNQMASAAMNDEMSKKVEEAALNQLIAKELLFQAGKKQEIKDLDKKIQEKVAEHKARFKSQADYEKALKEMDMTEKEVETFTREDMVIGNLIETKIVANTKITDDEAKKFYNDNKDKFRREEAVRASHILVSADQKASPEEKKKAKEKAEALLKQLKGGADFAELAKKESSCPSSAQGGDLGFFGKGQMVPEFEKTAFNLKPGEVSDVVETQFGYHIIKLAEKKDAETVPFEEAKERIVQFLTQQKVQAGIGEYVDELRKKGKVEILSK